MEETSTSLKELEKRLQRIESQNEEIAAVLHFLRRAVYYSRIWAIIKIVILVIPLLLGIIYLPSFLRASLNTFSLPLNPEIESFFK